MDYSRLDIREPVRRHSAPPAGSVQLARPLRFCAVGLCGLLVNMSVLWLLVNRLRLGLPPASSLANEAAVLTTFLLNDRWTFAAQGRHKPRWLRLLRFNGVALGGVLITVVLLTTLVAVFSLNLLLANLIAVAAGSAWNYKVGGRWAWGRGSDES